MARLRCACRKLHLRHFVFFWVSATLPVAGIILLRHYLQMEASMHRVSTLVDVLRRASRSSECILGIVAEIIDSVAFTRIYCSAALSHIDQASLHDIVINEHSTAPKASIFHHYIVSYLEMHVY